MDEAVVYMLGIVKNDLSHPFGLTSRFCWLRREPSTSESSFQGSLTQTGRQHPTQMAALTGPVREETLLFEVFKPPSFRCGYIFLVELG